MEMQELSVTGGQDSSGHDCHGGKVRALEFFSGIGAFAQTACAFNIEVVAAFDQSESANATYALNYGLQPCARNLDTIAAGGLPHAAIWWMSPPCTPFSIRGKRLDDCDPRAASFLNLIDIASRRLPEAIIVENVAGFVGSRVSIRFLAVLKDCGYQLHEFDLCPTAFGVPMRRPRHFVAAVRGTRRLNVQSFPGAAWQPLAHFLDTVYNPELIVDAAVMERYQQGFDIVDPIHDDSYLTCFTSGYWRCRKASGSLISLPGGGARRVSPDEIVRLLGFAADFTFPDKLDLPTRYRLAGNSVDVRAVRFLLESIGCKAMRC